MLGDYCQHIWSLYVYVEPAVHYEAPAKRLGNVYCSEHGATRGSWVL